MAEDLVALTYHPEEAPAFIHYQASTKLWKAKMRYKLLQSCDTNEEFFLQLR